MAQDWIPRKNSDLLSQSRTFADRINSDPAAWGVSPLEAAELVADQGDFAARYLLTSSPDTRTAPAILARNTARKTLTATMRALAARIRADQSISDADKIKLGLTIPGRAEHVSASALLSRPFVIVRSVVNNLVTLQLSDESNTLRHAKPPGVAGAELFYSAAPDLAAAERDWRSAGVTMSAKAVVKLPYLAPGTVVFIGARWFNHRGRGGPMSNEAVAYVGGMLIATSIAA